MSQLTAKQNRARRPFASVLVRTQRLRPRCLQETLDSLSAQTDDDIEVLLVSHLVDANDAAPSASCSMNPRFATRVREMCVLGGGRARPLNAGLDAARGRYLVFLDDDDLVTPDWIETFRVGADANPDAVVRSLTAVRTIAGPAVGGAGSSASSLAQAEVVHNHHFDLFQHWHDNQSPICSFAVPLDRIRDLDIRFDESLVLCEDWDFLLQATLALPVHDTHRATSIYQQWQHDPTASRVHGPEAFDVARTQLLRKLDELSLVQIESSPRCAAIRTLLASKQRDLLALRSDVEKLESTIESMHHARAESEQTILALERALREGRELYQRLVGSWSWRALTPLHRLLAFLRTSR